MIMSATRPPEAERARLEALGHYGVLDTPPEQAFDDLARLAALVCETRRRPGPEPVVARAVERDHVARVVVARR
jgi:hypothetical protein